MRIKFVHDDRLYTPEMTVYYEDFEGADDHIRCGDLNLGLYFTLFKLAGSNFHVIIRSHHTGKEHIVYCHSIDTIPIFLDTVHSYVNH